MKTLINEEGKKLKRRKEYEQKISMCEMWNMK